MRDLVEGFQVVRAALVFFLVVLARHRAEFQLAALGQTPESIRCRVTGAGADLTTDLIHQALDLRVFSAKDDRLAVFLDREAAEQRRFSATGRAAVENLVGLAEKGPWSAPRHGARSSAGHSPSIPRSCPLGCLPWAMRRAARISSRVVQNPAGCAAERSRQNCPSAINSPCLDSPAGG